MLCRGRFPVIAEFTVSVLLQERITLSVIYIIFLVHLRGVHFVVVFFPVRLRLSNKKNGIMKT